MLYSPPVEDLMGTSPYEIQLPFLPQRPSFVRDASGRNTIALVPFCRLNIAQRPTLQTNWHLLPFHVITSNAQTDGYILLKLTFRYNIKRTCVCNSCSFLIDDIEKKENIIISKQIPALISWLLITRLKLRTFIVLLFISVLGDNTDTRS